MDKIVIYGAGKQGIFLKQLLENDILKEKYECEVIYFCDTYLCPGAYVDGLKVISPMELKKIEGEIDKVVISALAYSDDIQIVLLNLKLSIDVYVIPEYVSLFKWNQDDMPLFVKWDLDKPRMPYLEIKIVEHCNLKCKGCSALSNINSPEFMSVDTFEADMKRLRQLFSSIKDLKLFGGEPLLHPELESFLIVARKYFPDANIIVHSNGLLIPKMKSSLFLLMHKKNIKLEFTQYPPTGLIKRQIIKILEKNGVAYKFRDALYEFQKIINIKGDYDAEEVYKTCEGCINLVKGTLSCGVGWTIKGLEEKYGLGICEDKFQRCVDIYSTELNGWEINKFLNAPSNLCKYCAFMYRGDRDKRMVQWKCGAPFEISDWIYQGEE